MKFTVSKTEIVKALSSTLGVVEKRQALPILSNVLLKVEDNNISITATDLESEVQTTCTPISVESAGSTTAPAKKLNELCRLLPDGSEISIFLNGDKLSVESGSGKYSISTLPSEDFPVFDVVSENTEFTILGSVLRNLISKTSFAMGNQDWRHYLNGLYLSVEDKSITAVATDAHRLALESATLNEAILATIDGIVPRKSINEIGKLVGEESENVVIYFGHTSIEVNISGKTFVSKLIEGKFPDYEQVIPSGESSLLVVDRKMFSESISRVSVLCGEDKKGIKFLTKENSLIISAINKGGEENLVCEYKGEEIEIGFNVYYLQQILSTINSDKVVIDFFGSKSCIITDPNSNSLKYVVMAFI